MFDIGDALSKGFDFIVDKGVDLAKDFVKGAFSPSKKSKSKGSAADVVSSRSFMDIQDDPIVQAVRPSKTAQSQPTNIPPTARDYGYTERVLAAAKIASQRPTGKSMEATIARLKAPKAKGPFLRIDDTYTK